MITLIHSNLFRPAEGYSIHFGFDFKLDLSETLVDASGYVIPLLLVQQLLYLLALIKRP